jgi:protein TonB
MALSPQRPAYEPDLSPSRAPGAPVLVVTTDDDLWIRLSAALPGLRMEQHDSVADLTASWLPSRPAAVLLDARAEADLARAVERLQTHSVALVPVAFVDEATLPAAITLERQKALFDHVLASLDPGTTLAVFERAAEEALARAALVPPGVTHSVDGPPPPRPPASRKPSPALLGAVAGLVIAGGVAAWWFTSSTPSTPPTDTATESAAPAGAGVAPAATPASAASSAAEAPTATGERIETLLASARAAMRDRRYIDPENDNALAHYRNVLTFDPENGEARQGLERIAEVLVGRAESAMASRDYPAALRSLEVARSLKPDHPKLAALDAQVGQRLSELSLAQIQAALQANAFERATTLIRQAERNGAVPAATLAQLRQEIARREARTEQNELVRLAQARIAQGRLVEPANDSAKRYLGELQQRGDAADALQRLRQEYNRRVVAEARAAIARGSNAEFEQWLAELRAAGAPASQVAALQREAAQPPQQPRAVDGTRLQQLATERLAQRRLLAPESDNAIHYYRALQVADPRNAQLPALRDALATALLEQARGAYEGGRSAEAQIAVDAAREFGVSAQAIAAVQPAAPATRAPIVISQPKLLRALQPSYPDRALKQGITGWVDVDFIVDVEGRAQEIRPAAAEPAGVFDASAVNAVRRARFEPARTADGTAVAMASRLRVRFALE